MKYLINLICWLLTISGSKSEKGKDIARSLIIVSAKALSDLTDFADKLILLSLFYHACLLEKVRNIETEIIV